MAIIYVVHNVMLTAPNLVNCKLAKTVANWSILHEHTAKILFLSTKIWLF